MLRTLLSGLVIFTVVLGAAEFCAVRVILTDTGGAPIDAMAELIDSQGQVIQRTTSQNGEARFCDFGFGDHTIRIGGSSCGEVTFPHIRLHFGRTRVLKAYLNRCSGDEFLGVCRVYLRVTAQEYGAVSDVVITSASPGPAIRTDRFGRAQLDVSLNERRTFYLNKEGFERATFDVNCSMPDYIEKAVFLMKSRQR